MKTFPILREDGSLRAFEVSSAWVTFRPLYRILRSVPGVANIKRNWFNDDRIAFTFEGVACVIHEPWGDNSRFWIGPVSQDSRIDIEPLHDAFKRYNRFDWFGVMRVRHDG
jgi:hypothetical protein